MIPCVPRKPHQWRLQHRALRQTIGKTRTLQLSPRENLLAHRRPRMKYFTARPSYDVGFSGTRGLSPVTVNFHAMSKLFCYLSSRVFWPLIPHVIFHISDSPHLSVLFLIRIATQPLVSISIVFILVLVVACIPPSSPSFGYSSPRFWFVFTWLLGTGNLSVTFHELHHSIPSCRSVSACRLPLRSYHGQLRGIQYSPRLVLFKIPGRLFHMWTSRGWSVASCTSPTSSRPPPPLDIARTVLLSTYYTCCCFSGPDCHCFASE